MNIQNLKDVFEKFATDNNRAILIDGPWGVGKTYHILQFLKDSKGSKPKRSIAYVSLFGKSSIDEVHTEIYSRLHPVRHNSKKIIQVIPKVAPLLGAVGDIVDNLEFALKNDNAADATKDATMAENISAVEEIAEGLKSLNDSSKETIRSSSKKSRSIIILDDFERLNFDKITFTDVLGYVNSLFLQNFKVIVVCNSREIPDTEDANFVSFKEKVFDREYIITATNDEIINSYFSNVSVSLDKYITDEFDSNLRIAKRVSNFYSETMDIIKKLSKDYLKKSTNESILWACTLVVVACNTSKYTQNEVPKKSLGDEMMLASLCIDDSLHGVVMNINNYVNSKGLGAINNQLVSGLLLLYYYNDKSGLENIYLETAQLQNPFLEEAFLLSDSEKEDLFNRQYKYILEQKELKIGSIVHVAKTMCKYPMFSHIDERENDIIDAFLKKCDDKDIYRLSSRVFIDDSEDERYLTFINNFNKIRTEKYISDTCDEFLKLYNERNYSALIEKINCLSREPVYSTVLDEKRILIPKIFKTIKKCNFFIDDLFEAISEPQWTVAHQICDLSREYNFSNEVAEYINKIDYKDDQSARERYSYLLKNKLDCNS